MNVEPGPTELVMALTDTSHRVFQRGTWPGAISLRRGWARAEARPWNSDHPEAHLRLIRGGSNFLSDCVSRLVDIGAPSVLSTPLAASARKPWEAAGFETAIDLALLRLSLDRDIPGPDHLVQRSDDVDIESLLCIDQAAFEGFWRFDRTAVAEAMHATSKADVFTISDGTGGAAGYAVIGYGHAISYLQRVAVHPEWQGQGMGRSLIRSGARAAKRSGSKALLLNTQAENAPAINLYHSEGYVLLPETLSVLRAG